MIAEWRALWNQGDFPFLFVQLPNFMAPQKKPSETSAAGRSSASSSSRRSTLCPTRAWP